METEYDAEDVQETRLTRKHMRGLQDRCPVLPLDAQFQLWMPCSNSGCPVPTLDARSNSGCPVLTLNAQF